MHKSRLVCSRTGKICSRLFFSIGTSACKTASPSRAAKPFARASAWGRKSPSLSASHAGPRYPSACSSASASSRSLLSGKRRLSSGIRLLVGKGRKLQLHGAAADRRQQPFRARREDQKHRILGRFFENPEQRILRRRAQILPARDDIDLFRPSFGRMNTSLLACRTMSTATFLCSVSSTVITSGCCFARTLRHAGQTPQPGSRSFYIRAPPPSEAPASFVPSPPRRKEGSSARFSPAGSSPANAVSARHCQEMRQSPSVCPFPRRISTKSLII